MLSNVYIYSFCLLTSSFHVVVLCSCIVNKNNFTKRWHGAAVGQVDVCQLQGPGIDPKLDLLSV